jgi:hypothetical protein
MSEIELKNLDLTGLPREVVALYQLVARKRGRVEVASPDGGCVIISKAELEALESALQILSDTDGMKDVAEQLAHVAALCENEHLAAG